MEKRLSGEITIQPRLLDANQLAVYLGLGKNLAVDWGKKNRCFRRFGSRVLYDRQQVDRILDEMEAEYAKGEE